MKNTKYIKGMMKDGKRGQTKVDSREVGLALGLIAGRYFLKTEDLHYGYWPEGLELTPSNLPRAQELYSDLILSRIPEQTTSILDVGCGAGALAEKLRQRGYQVDAVNPSSYLAAQARARLGPEVIMFECRFEDLQTDRRYDLILFSESFQYIRLGRGLEKTLELLNERGALLICDFFKTTAEGDSVLGGGHRLAKFYERIAQYPFQLVCDLDITAQTAPNLDLVNDGFQKLGKPAWDLILSYLDSNYPYLARFLQWKYRDKIAELHRKYFSGERNAANFARFKSYRLMVYQKS
jgi:SAM-dependent methyltransferase